jgi:DNA-binding GntR family transcriptional regulator
MQAETPQRDGVKALNILRQRILRLEMSPGSVIDENALASMLSLSRTPIREAIIQLISEGLAIREGRFARVAPLSFDEVPKLYEALLVASRMIIRLAAEHRTDAELKAITAAHREFERQMYSGDDLHRQEANVVFHLAIADAAHNSYFYEFYHKTLTASSRLARACFSGAGKNAGNTGPVSEISDPELFAHVTETSRQHALMVKAIEARDIEAADDLAVQHHALACNRIQNMMFSLPRSTSNVSLKAGPNEAARPRG